MSASQWCERAAGTFSVEPAGDGVTVLRLLGEHDLSTRDGLLALGETAVEQGDLVVDLAAVEFIDASTIRAAVVLHARAGEAGVSFTLVLPPDGLPRRVLELCEIPGLIPCVESRQDGNR